MESLRHVLYKNGISLAKTVYKEQAIWDFGIPVDKGLELKKVPLDAYSFRKVNAYLDMLKSARSSADYIKVKEELALNSEENQGRKVELRKKKSSWKSNFRKRPSHKFLRSIARSSRFIPLPINQG